MAYERKLTIKYCALQATYWMLAAVGLAFVTPLLEAKGFSSVEIGWLNGVKYLSVIVFQIGIAAFTDKHVQTVSLKWIMGIMAAVSIVAAGIFWLAKDNFMQAVVIFVLYGATVNCLSPIVDSLSIQYMNHGRNFNYTLSRAWGSGMWATSCVVIGWFSDFCGVNNILLLQIGATVLFLCVVVIMDPVDFSKGAKQEETKAAEQKMPSKVHSSWHLLCHYPKYTLFLLGCMVIFMGYNLNATFMIDVIQNLGGSHTDFGIGEFVLAISEVPVALFFVKMRRKFSIDQLMIVCAAFCTFRAGATTFAPTVPLVILSQGFELFGLSIFYAGSVYFVMENLPDTDVVKGVSFINVASVGIGQTIASVTCGMLKTYFGLHNLLVISTLVSLAAVFIMIVMSKAPREIDLSRARCYNIPQEKQG